MATEIDDVEPAATFIQKIGTRTSRNKVEVDLAAAGPFLGDRVVVSKTSLDLFAARLFHESPELYRDFMEAFPAANAGTFVGFGDT